MGSLGKHKLRTFFMALGTLIGVAALTVVVAFGRGTQEAVLENIDRMFSGSSILLTAGGGSMMGGPMSDGPTTTLTIQDLEAIEATIPEVIVSDPQQMAGPREVVFGGRSDEARITGNSHNAERVWNRGVTRGAYFSESDVEQSARVALVGETVVRELFEGADPIGQQIRVGTVPLDVIGVLEPVGIDPHGWDRDDEIIIPISTMMRRVLNVDHIMMAKMLVSPDVELDPVVYKIEELLRERHALAADVPNDFHMITPVQVEELVESSNRVFTVFLPLIAAVSVVVGGIVVANLMLMAVNERRAEIGLRKAVGARTRDIWLQFLIESASVTALGGLLALGLGFVVLQILGRVMDTAARFPWEAAVFGMGAAIAVGLIAGVAPARRAAELEPVQTLR